MARPIDPTKKDSNGVYISRTKSWQNRTQRGNTYYLSLEDHKLAKRVKRKLKLKTVTEAIRHALTLADSANT